MLRNRRQQKVQQASVSLETQCSMHGIIRSLKPCHEFLSTKKLLLLPFLRNKALNIQMIQPIIQKWLSKSRRGIVKRAFLIREKKLTQLTGLLCVAVCNLRVVYSSH